MVINIITRKGNKMQLSGDKLSGDTFAEKDYIKSKLGGKNWNKDTKTWEVDVAQVERWLNITGAHIRIDDSVVSPAPTGKMSYAEFARRMDDPNSDY